MVKKILILCLASSLLCGCIASQAIRHEQQGKFVQAPTANKACIVLIRKLGFIGAVGTWFVLLDGKMMAGFNVGNYLAKDIDPGEHILSLSSPMTILLDAGKTYYYNIDPFFSPGKYDFELISEEEGQKLTENYTRIKSSF